MEFTYKSSSEYYLRKRNEWLAWLAFIGDWVGNSVYTYDVLLHPDDYKRMFIYLTEDEIKQKLKHHRFVPRSNVERTHIVKLIRGAY